MCDQDALVGYLYDELTPADRQTFERHLASCEACRLEVRALQATRSRLGAWQSPEPAMDFEIGKSVSLTCRARCIYPVTRK